MFNIHCLKPGALFNALLVLLVIGAAGASAQAVNDPAKTLDIADLTAGVDPLARVAGAGGEFRVGLLGLPVAGGFDMDGDGYQDYAGGYMTAAPFARFIAAGELYLTFGDGTTSRLVDLNNPQPTSLRITGSTPFEGTATELWMGDVTGDGLGDLLIARQNFDPGSRLGAGALTILVGSPELRNLAAAGTVVDLAAPPPSVTLFDIVGSQAFNRLAIWMRTGDVDGDGIDDIAVGSDQESSGSTSHHGAVYVLRGGSHLDANATLDLADFGSTPFAGNVARLLPPTDGEEFHFGATCQIADLDGNGRGEVLAAAALNRSGASLGPFGIGSSHGSGGAPGGRLYIAWDDLFPSGAWPAGFTIDLAAGGPSVTSIDGGVQNISFGEEIVGGLDYDGDGNNDLFVGDLAGDGTETQDRQFSGIGYMISKASLLKGLSFNIDDVPPAIYVSKMLGPNPGAIGADTVAQGDFDGDGIADLANGSPHAHPLGRFNAGVVHVVFGRHGNWPKLIDTAPGRLPPASRLRITEVLGAKGRDFSIPGPFGIPFGEGDTLCYSAAPGDVDGDGKTDLITNEMVGDGLNPGDVDAGNLIVLSGELLTAPRFDQAP